MLLPLVGKPVLGRRDGNRHAADRIERLFERLAGLISVNVRMGCRMGMLMCVILLVTMAVMTVTAATAGVVVLMVV